MPGGASVDIWGYVLGSTCAPGDATIPGPVIRPTPGAATLTINLTNNLSESVSFFVPGMVASSATGIAGRFTGEAGASGGTASYTFNLTGRSGTFLYHSATNRIRTQVPMGMYGALVVDAAAGQAYADVAYDSDQVLVYSEIDPALNADPTGMDGAKVINWLPQYFLINGQAYPNTTSLPITVGDNVLLRFVNAGLDSVMPTLGGGLYMNLKAEDGNRYPHSIHQYGLDLQAGKTIDAMIQVTAAGRYAIYDRSDHTTNGAASGGGMLVNLDAAAGAGLLQFNSATYSVAENVVGGIATFTVDRIGGGAGAVSVDYATVDGSATDGLDYTGSAGTLNFADGVISASFDVPILDDATWEGDENFSIDLSNATGGAVIGSPTSTVVTILEDDPGPGMLQLSAATYSAVENGGTLTFTVDRVGGSAGAATVDYATTDGTATDGPDYTGSAGTLSWVAGDATSQNVAITILDDLTYEGDEDFFVSLSNATGASIGVPASAIATILEDEPAPNVAPTAVDDFTTSPRGETLANYDIVANDEDLDGTIDPTSVVITTGATTQRGGTVVNNGDGTITYDPPNPGFTGTDTFQYTVDDNVGATSNVATVHINVTK
ncbi:MAG: Ig-like domain-containing protein [Thermoanaerobaculales bacterium]|nr:Ig-like domain-containing protein [Thermoanaerobaculales bacterium]